MTRAYHFKASCGCAGTITQFCSEAERLQAAIEAARAKCQEFAGVSSRPIPFELYDACDQAMRAFLAHMAAHAVHHSKASVSMSSSFDTMGHAILWLEQKANPDGADEQVHQVALYLRLAVDRLHDLHHEGVRQLNVVAATQIRRLRVSLTHNDAEDRNLMLAAILGRHIPRDAGGKT